MLKIAICEDHVEFGQQVAQAVKQVLQDHHVPHHITVVQTGECLLAAGVFDIVLLDIELPGQNGIEIATAMRRQGNLCNIVFLTSHPKYVFSAFDVEASNYLLKPIDQRKLEKTLMKLVHKHNEEAQACYTVKCGTQVHRVPFTQIEFAEIFGRKVTLHTPGRTFVFNGKLEELEQAFPGGFFRCHKSYLINLSKIISYDRACAVLQGGQTVPIARRKYAALGTAFLAFLQKEGEV